MEYGWLVSFSNIVFFSSSIVVLYVAYLTSMPNISYDNETSKIWVDRLPSSIWCTHGPAKERLCKFKNICFDPVFHEFQFMITEDSIISGVEDNEAWMNIALSTVLGHNAFYMKISLLKQGNKHLTNYTLFNSSPTFIMHRFKSDNVMHVLHDDLIPLHFTLESISHNDYNFKELASLAFVDPYKESFFDEWYKTYSKRNIIVLSQLNHTVCFADAFSGLLRSTLWFDYGFGKPQGKFINDQFNVRGIRSFVEYNHLQWNEIAANQEEVDSDCTKAVVIVRSQSRRILNLELLLDAISKAHSTIFPSRILKVVTLDLAVLNSTYVLSELSDAELLVGMHGAGMIMSLFLPPWASVVELFPFAINPNHVSFLKALVSQSDSYPLHYEVWQNWQRKNSFPGSLGNPLLGQISHLPKPKQEEILAIAEVPAVHCCHDPAYLYYMYHDTMISDDVYHTIYRAMIKTQTRPNFQKINYEIHPSPLTFFSCKVMNETLMLHWGEFSNQHDIERLWFQITVQHGNVIMVKNETEYSVRMLKVNLGTFQAEVHAWIQPYNNYIGGHIVHSRCNISS